MSFQILKPFGPSIVKTTIPEDIIIEMNKYVDDIINDAGEMNKLNHGKYLAGNVTNEFRLDIEFMKKIKWSEFLAKSCQKWLLEEHNISLNKFHLIASWVIRQYKNEYNPWHTHSGNFSAVIYLKILDGMEDHFENEKRDHYPTSGLIDFKFGEKQDMRSDTFLYHPKLRRMLMFPSWLNHTVYPFYCEGERRSMSFNAHFFIPEGWHKKLS